jgi:hypothetical protein
MTLRGKRRYARVATRPRPAAAAGADAVAPALLSERWNGESG